MPFLTGRVNAHQRLCTREADAAGLVKLGPEMNRSQTNLSPCRLRPKALRVGPEKRRTASATLTKVRPRYARTFAELRRRQAHAIGVIAK